MDRWKTKDDFIKWITQERNKSSTLHYYLCSNFQRYPKIYSKDCTCELTVSGVNANVNPLYIKSILDNKILEHLNAYLYDRDIDIYHIRRFFETIESVNFFKKSGLSRDPQEYNRGIESLKKMADKLQILSDKQITVKIPILPYISIYNMKTEFKRLNLSKDDIYIFTSYFGTRYRETNSFKFEKKRLKEIYFSLLTLEHEEHRKNSETRRKKYNDYSWRTEKEYQEMMKERKEVSLRYEKERINKSFYYEAQKNNI